MAEDSSITLQTVIDEFRNISPEITKSLVFKKDGEIQASVGNSIGEDIAKSAACFDEIANQAEVIGGVEILTIYGTSSKMEITRANNYYIATVASPSANEKIVKALTRVIMPTVIKLLDQSKPQLPDNPPTPELPDNPPPVVPPVKEVEEEVKPPEGPKPIVKLPISQAAPCEPELPKPPVNQFMVEKIGGLMVAPDIVRVDAEVVTKWSDLYGKRQITHVQVETLEGRAVRCKFRPMREADRNLKGIIQIPEKILQILSTGEGKLVMVKPFIFKMEAEQS